ncbi:glycosyltransferase family 4 protein [Paenibacillus sp. PR3]|uniref:Glycosyltransferase family 4 protein n=1 Tax=Paenibacillus terricola TaxID=2763503 RepID=A0ABR8MXK3_9BACL|nr:glycosyltransferase family 4 protein [Paenibacillus terricola]MBD3920694.1 glycosyltransferase family 4 protein [Paenibacillus terricola]
MFVTHSDLKGGAEQSLIHLINHIDQSKYKIMVAAPKNTTYLNEILVPYEHIEIRLESVKKKLGFSYLRNVMKLASFVRRERIAIVHANGWRAPWFVAPMKFLTKARIIWHHRDYFPSSLMYNLLLPQLFDKVICISNFVGQSLQSGRKSIIYNGIDKRALTKKSRMFMEDGQFIIGTFGRIVEWKRYELVIEAIQRLVANNINNCKLMIVGGTAVDGSGAYYEMMKSTVSSYGLESHVEFVGHTKEPLKLMGQCDFTINFSLNEPFGRVIIESLLAQTPVVVSDSGGAPEIIQLTGGGVVVEDGNVEALADCIQQLMTSPEHQHIEMAEQGFERVLEHFDMKNVALQVEQVYEELLK